MLIGRTDNFTVTVLNLFREESIGESFSTRGSFLTFHKLGGKRWVYCRQAGSLLLLV
jgi:hypothetical protein